MTDAARLQAQVVAMNEALMLGSVQQHELTEAAEALNTQLRREMSERSALEWKAQEQATKLADLDRRKDEFLAMLSHELRSPLAAISNAAQLLSLQSSEDPVQRKARDIIERQVGHLTHLVQDMMDVSRITTGKVQLRRKRIAWSDIVERAVETTRALLHHHGHQLTMSVPPEPIWLHADATRMEQVVVNLLTNAAKYSAPGGHIWLSIQEQRGWSELRVRDQGVGIAPELQATVFDLFTQADRSLDRSEGGLGIGLYVVQRLVEMHGGTVEVSSILGHGSEFTVRLPVQQTVLPPPPPVPSTATAHPPNVVSRVLVVDDDDDTADGMAELLRASGHDVRVASDGPAALEAALDYLPNVVLMDIGLPMLNGYEVAARMRQHAELRQVVLVAITGYGQDKDRERTRTAGFEHHLVKPADFREVERIIAASANRTRNLSHT